ncbi:MAG: pilus assembly protein [Chloroflexi bacterium]|nr:pilus assembly protein [Chloroflexota bacterium]
MYAPEVEGSARNSERGQGLVEYGLVIILVAIVIVAILAVLGPQISNLYSRVTSGIGGT